MSDSAGSGSPGASPGGESAPAPRSPCPTFEVWIEGEPKGQPRVRPFLRGGKPRVYMPTTAAPWQDVIALAVREFMPATPTTDPVSVHVVFAFLRPQSHFRKSGAVKPAAPPHHVSRTDVDNLLKSLLDALTHCGLWRDDAQVTDLVVRKRWTLGAAGATLRVGPSAHPLECAAGGASG